MGIKRIPVEGTKDYGHDQAFDAKEFDQHLSRMVGVALCSQEISYRGDSCYSDAGYEPAV